MTNKSIKIQYGCSVRNADGKEVVHKESHTNEFATYPTCQASHYCAWRMSDFAERSELTESLVNGSLIVEVRMKPTTTGKSIAQFVPTNPFNKNMLELFMDEETADVVFEVGGHRPAGREKTEFSNTSFHAHRPILQKCAPTLYEMCGKPAEGGNVTTVSITDVKPKIFKHMVYYAYGGKLSEEELKNNAKDIINACDKYGVVHLKLEAEAIYVESTKI